MKVDLPHAVSWNLTARCNLACAHCYLDAGARRTGEGDPTTGDCLRIIREMADVNDNLLLILTGGEPMLRPDLTEISRTAAEAGMTVVVGSNGTLIDRSTAARLKASGVAGVGISLESASRPSFHDGLRGKNGAWEGAVGGIIACREMGLDVLVQTSVFRWNRDDLREIGELASKLGAKAWNLYFLVCTGRGQELTDLSPQEYEDTLHELRDLQEELSGEMLVSVRCAPQFRRVMSEGVAPAAPFRTYASGCPAAVHYCRIGPKGELTPCPYMDIEAGRLTPDTSFRQIWEEAPLLAAIRDRSKLTGKCGTCAYSEACGGCRARALAINGSPLAEDPSCAYDPSEAVPDRPPDEPTPATYGLPEEATMPWSEEAVVRLGRTPSFVRGMVVKRVEQEARERGAAEVTPEIMADVRAKAMPGGAAFGMGKGGAPDGAVMSRMKAMFGSGEATSQDSPSPSPPKPGKAAARIRWTEEALERRANAPDFVRPGVKKLVEMRARQHGRTEVTSDFLSEIRDESMMRVVQVMQRFGLSEVKPEAFAEARKRMSKKPHKLLVLDKIEEMLERREHKNPVIIDKFEAFMEAAPRKGKPWMPEATQRLEQLPRSMQPEVRRAVEQEAKRMKAPVVTAGVMDCVLGTQEVTDGPS